MFKHESKELFACCNQEYPAVWVFTNNPTNPADSNCGYKQRLLSGYIHSADVPSTKNMYWQNYVVSKCTGNVCTGKCLEKVAERDRWTNTDLLRIHTDNSNSIFSQSLK